MNNFFDKNKIFLAIIIGAFIIGAFIYFGSKYGGRPCFLRPQKTRTESNVIQKTPLMQKSMPNGKTDSVKDANTSTCWASDNTIVTRVIDGDTVVVEGGYHVRFLEIDTDEVGEVCYETAKNRLKELVLNKEVILEKDQSDVDKYGRCLRTLFLNGVNINMQLVKEGFAVASFYEPDVKYKAEIIEAEKQAQQNGLGCKWEK